MSPVASRALALFFSLALVRSAPLPFDGVLRLQPDGSTVAYLPPPAAANHASTIEQLPSGGLLLAWFSGAGGEDGGFVVGGQVGVGGV